MRYLKTTNPRGDVIAGRHNVNSQFDAVTDDLTVACGPTANECLVARTADLATRMAAWELVGDEESPTPVIVECPYDHMDDVRPGEEESDEAEFIRESRRLAAENTVNITIPNLQAKLTLAEGLKTVATEDLAAAENDKVTARWLKNIGKRWAAEEIAVADQDITTARDGLETAQANLAELAGA